MTEHEPAHVVATAGHVDHGKSSLIVRLTGIDPDRWAEEKRRGLTIDLGFAWTTLPSGREIGFVDVPGHERFIRNMLAGVGSVRLVLFVVAADEGWKPQSEEHLEILDVLGVDGGVVALTKIDLVDADRAAEAVRELRARLEGTTLADAPIVRCSSVTGTGLDTLVRALDELVSGAPAPTTHRRPRLAIDRSFTIRGAGTVVTGTLTGGPMRVGDEVHVYPNGPTARVRSLQTHRRARDIARAVSRVAVNLAGVATSDVERGDVLAEPGRWRPTSTIDARVTAVRSLAHPLRARGAFKLYVGSAERDATIRLYDRGELGANDSAYARIAVARPVVVEHGDRFVLRESGRRETVAGGVVLDAHPPAKRGVDAPGRLARREATDDDGLGALVVEERGALRASELAVLTGRKDERIEGATLVGRWWVADAELRRLERTVRDTLAAHHRDHPLRPGLDAAETRRRVLATAPAALGPSLDHGLLEDVLAGMERSGTVVREATLLRLREHEVTVPEAEASPLVRAVADAEPVAPTLRELLAEGFAPELVDACVAAGLLVRISQDIVATPEFAGRAERLALAEAATAGGVTVSRFRELLGTTRKYAVPILEWLDERGVTRRDGDVRRPA